MPTLFSSLDRESHLPTMPAAGLLIAALLAAFWPLAPWFARRLHDNHDEPLGLLALLAALILLWTRRNEWRVSAAGCWGACGILMMELVFHRELPSLIEAGMLMLAISLMLALPRRAPGIAMLLMLSLPVIASMQFYLGYPLRLGAAWFSETVMNLLGCEVARVGTSLMWHGAEVGVDPPCSGVRMLWVACFVAAVLGARSQMKLRPFVMLMISAVAMVVLANAVRAMLLLPSEAGVMLPFAGLHEGVGIGVMIAAFFVLVRWHDWLASGTGILCVTGAAGILPAGSGRIPDQLGDRQDACPTRRFAFIVMLGLGIATGVMQVLRPDEGKSCTAEGVQWPLRFEGQVLETLKLSAFEDEFEKTFPGRLARFRCGGSEVVMRHIVTASRAVHSSRECFQAKGYELKSMGHWMDRDGGEWSRFSARLSNETYLVREQIRDARGKVWTDVGAWYWAALFEPSGGPWRFVSVIEALPRGLAAR